MVTLEDRSMLGMFDSQGFGKVSQCLVELGGCSMKVCLTAQVQIVFRLALSLVLRFTTLQVCLVRFYAVNAI